MERSEVKALLVQKAEENYKKFNDKLIPGVKNTLGVRMAGLKEIAKLLSGDNYEEYFKELDTAADFYHEEIMVQALTIGMIKVSTEEKLKYIAAFVPKIDNWAVCDSFCAGLKFTKKNKEVVWDFIQPYLKDKREYYVRFGVVMLMDYFIDEEHIQTNLELLENIKHEGYYVKMAVAWAVSVCFVKFPQITKQFFEKKTNSLDDFTYNKAIQKIRESYRASKEDKEYLNQLKRKKAVQN
ncbi:MAG: DNA alkylation repair protein [Clostridiales bacterium]|nr:DNA alkylation repair protein [Clostridiales bacterium]